MNNDIFNIDLTRTLPPALKNDRTVSALSQVIARELQGNAEMIRNNVIYARIDELPEKLLDVLAYDLHVDWYDYDYPLDTKREIVKTSVRVHRKLGTVYAVETAIRAIHEDCRIEEWFEYGGTPFCFRVVVNLSRNKLNISLEEIIKRIYMCKRLTAHMEALILTREFERKLFLGVTRIERVAMNIPCRKTGRNSGGS